MSANAKCERQKRARERPDSDAETVTGQPDSSGDETQPQPGCSETRQTPAKRTSKRKRAVTESPPKRVNESEGAAAGANEGTYPMLMTIMNRLEVIASEGRSERDRLAAQSREDREYFQSAIAALQPRANVLSDDEEQDQSKAAKEGERGASGGSADTRRPVVAEDLVVGRSMLQDLRDDGPSSRAANDILRRHGVQEEGSKKLKSGYNLTINDSATVIAQWPQMNVIRSANDTATYGSLTINEFVSGYMIYIHDCLNGKNPDVLKALDYVAYLHDLLDDIPLIGWERGQPMGNY